MTTGLTINEAFSSRGHRKTVLQLNACYPALAIARDCTAAELKAATLLLTKLSERLDDEI
jgi:hypothetical protein